MTFSDVFAGILVGGRGTRLGGTDKAALPHPEGGTFLDHLIREVKPKVSRVVVVGRPGQAVSVAPELLPIHRVSDRRPDQGPLGGLEALLESAPAPWCLALACDLPGFTASLADLLVAAGRGGAPAILLTDGVRTHPLPGLYHHDCLRTIRRRLTEGRRSLIGLFEDVGGQVVSVPPNLAPGLLNVNDPADLENAREDR